MYNYIWTRIPSGERRATNWRHALPILNAPFECAHEPKRLILEWPKKWFRTTSGPFVRRAYHLTSLGYQRGSPGTPGAVSAASDGPDERPSAFDGNPGKGKGLLCQACTSCGLHGSRITLSLGTQRGFLVHMDALDAPAKWFGL